MLSLETGVGLAAAFCTTIANVPQVRKSWQTGTAHDLSLKMLLLLMTGVALWLLYGLLKADGVILLANLVTLFLLALILSVKLGFPARPST